jgi:F-type H+-transporting ATPase subunit gamma
MANTRQLVRRRKSVRNTRKITKTMEKISTAKLAKAQNAAIAARPYAQKLREIIGEVASASADVKHPLLEAHPQPKKAVVIVLTSDRGLCGAFNSNLVKAARNIANELKAKGRELSFIVQGKKGVAAFKYMNLPVMERLIGISDKPSYQRAESIADKLIAAYGKYEVDEVYIVYSAFKGAGAQAPTTEALMPLSSLTGEKSDGKDKAKKAESGGYIFHPNPADILAQVLPLVVKMSIFTAMLQNTASEHAARRVAMKNATDSADDMIKLLSRQYNRARQGKITQEIAEIVGGAAALS